VTPAKTIGLNRRSSPCRSGRKSQQKICVWVARISVREAETPEQRIVLLQVGRFVSTDLKSALDRMAATIIVEMFLPLLHKIFETRIAYGSLCDRRHP